MVAAAAPRPLQPVLRAQALQNLREAAGITGMREQTCAGRIVAAELRGQRSGLGHRQALTEAPFRRLVEDTAFGESHDDGVRTAVVQQWRTQFENRKTDLFEDDWRRTGHTQLPPNVVPANGDRSRTSHGHVLAAEPFEDGGQAVIAHRPLDLFRVATGQSLKFAGGIAGPGPGDRKQVLCRTSVDKLRACGVVDQRDNGAVASPVEDHGRAVCLQRDAVILGAEGIHRAPRTATRPVPFSA